MSTPRPADRCNPELRNTELRNTELRNTELRNTELRNTELRNARPRDDSSLTTGSPRSPRRWRLSWRRALSYSPLSGVLGVLLLVSGVACASSGVSREDRAGSAPPAAVESASVVLSPRVRTRSRYAV